LEHPFFKLKKKDVVTTFFTTLLPLEKSRAPAKVVREVGDESFEWTFDDVVVGSSGAPDESEDIALSSGPTSPTSKVSVDDLEPIHDTLPSEESPYGASEPARPPTPMPDVPSRPFGGGKDGQDAAGEASMPHIVVSSSDESDRPGGGGAEVRKKRGFVVRELSSGSLSAEPTVSAASPKVTSDDTTALPPPHPKSVDSSRSVQRTVRAEKLWLTD
jgi:hypothetical protein